MVQIDVPTSQRYEWQELGGGGQLIKGPQATPDLQMPDALHVPAPLSQDAPGVGV
jgi:hypothetical protein